MPKTFLGLNHWPWSPLDHISIVEFDQLFHRSFNKYIASVELLTYVTQSQKSYCSRIYSTLRCVKYDEIHPTIQHVPNHESLILFVHYVMVKFLLSFRNSDNVIDILPVLIKHAHECNIIKQSQHVFHVQSSSQPTRLFCL